MNRLPLSLRHCIFHYIELRELFLSQSISKQWKADLDKKNLWKALKRIHHRYGPEVNDPKVFIIDVLRGYSSQKGTVDDFEFIVMIKQKEEMIERLSWR